MTERVLLRNLRKSEEVNFYLYLPLQEAAIDWFIFVTCEADCLFTLIRKAVVFVGTVLALNKFNREVHVIF